MNETYKCAICGKEYEKLADRIFCETTCIKKRDEAEKKRKELELKVTKEKRLKEIDEAYETYTALLKKYVDDFGGGSMKIVNCYDNIYPTCADIFKNIIGY